jgi:hypothetical protein
VSDDDDDPTAIRRFDWERIVKRARMNPSTKLVALAIATYADKGGDRMYPGVQKLAAVTGLTDRTVRTALRVLRDDLCLLERTYEGSRNGRRGLADEYRLRRPHDIDRRTHMLDPTESLKSIECADDCAHPGSPAMSSGDRPVDNPVGVGVSHPEHRNSVPRTPELSSGTGEMSSANTGNEFPPSVPDHPRDHPLHQPRHPVGDATTDGDLLARLQEIDRENLAKEHQA